MMQHFRALDYTADDSFIEADYTFNGSQETGWDITRNGQLYLHLGPGYRLLKTVACGICSTDIARRFLPFPLPQVTGHEVVAEDMATGIRYVVEINDTPHARGEAELDQFALAGLHTHTPGRMVLGIDRLPGGFGPYILAPVNALVEYGELSLSAAVLVEPFAAALQALNASPPADGEQIAVLGTGRLGNLLILALKLYKMETGKNFQITALSRHQHLLATALKIGADQAINVNGLAKKNYHIVYDTTGSPDGLELALQLAAREVHLKSTNGQEFHGLKNLTAFVVDELSLLPYNKNYLTSPWREFVGTMTAPLIVYAAPGVDINSLPETFKVIQCSFSEAEKMLQGDLFKHRLPRFDLGIGRTMADIDGMIRPSARHENSLIRPRGTILVQDSGQEQNPLFAFIQRGGLLRSSRCGDFRKAVAALHKNREVTENAAANLVTAVFGADELPQAFVAAQSGSNTKVMLKWTGG